MIFDEERFLCSECPCLNWLIDDYGEEVSCNLGYDCELRWNEKKELLATSENCELIKIVTENGVIFNHREKSRWTNRNPSYWEDK